MSNLFVTQVAESGPTSDDVDLASLVSDASETVDETDDRDPL